MAESKTGTSAGGKTTAEAGHGTAAKPKTNKRRPKPKGEKKS